MSSFFFPLIFSLLATSALSLPLDSPQIRVRRQMGLYSQTYGSSFQPMPMGVVTYQRMVPVQTVPVSYGPAVYTPMGINSGFNPGYGSSFGYPQMSNPAYMMGFRNRARH